MIQDLPEDLEWKIIYVGSAESEEYDQVIVTFERVITCWWCCEFRLLTPCTWVLSLRVATCSSFRQKSTLWKGRGGMSENTLLPSSISLVSAGRPLSPASAWKNDGMKSLLEAWFILLLMIGSFPLLPFPARAPCLWREIQSMVAAPGEKQSCQKSLNRIYWRQSYIGHSTYQQSNKDNRFSEWYTRLYQTWVCAKHFNFCI